MEIIDFEIQNFRSYKNEKNKLKFNNKITVIVGKNNVGKTNILRAFYLFFNPTLYNSVSDRNYIKQITGGATKDPKLKLTLSDDKTFRSEGVQSVKYEIICDLNEDHNFYSVKYDDKQFQSDKLNSSSKIKRILDRNFKCLFLSTTDEGFSLQSENLISEMILEYFKKRNSQVKETIDDFEGAYETLIESFSENIGSIEDELGNEFHSLENAGIDIKPKLVVDNEETITKFLQDKISLKLDDDYEQDLAVKGAGLQRTSLILLAYFLLSELYPSQFKFVLIDEPEAYLYPLLVDKIKEKIEHFSKNENKSHTILTTHSRSFLSEVNNMDLYDFLNIEQEKELNTYARSKNDEDINKYSIISSFNRKTKYNVLKNYGLLDSIDNYEEIIICEGQTDSNYLSKIIQGQDFYPQIRHSGVSYNVSNDSRIQDLDYDYIGKGANSILPLLVYLDKISNINRNVFVLLDGDQEGRKVFNKIHENEYPHLNIKKYILDDGKEIEDMVFTREKFIDYILDMEAIINKENFRSFFRADGNISKSVIEILKNYLSTYHPDLKIMRFKHYLSTNLDSKEVQGDWLIPELQSLFMSES